jgi:hypothetical protein
MIAHPPHDEAVELLAAATADLTAVIAGETARLASGRLDPGPDDLAEKRAACEAYARAFRAMDPQGLDEAGRERLAGLHAGLATALERNLATLATARAVAEGLVRAFADAATRDAGAGLYGPAPRGAPAAAVRPLAYAARA